MKEYKSSDFYHVSFLEMLPFSPPKLKFNFCATFPLICPNCGWYGVYGNMRDKVGFRMYSPKSKSYNSYVACVNCDKMIEIDYQEM